MTSTPSHLMFTRLRRAEESAPATTPSVPTHVKRSRRSKRKAKAALTRARKTPSAAAMSNILQTPTRPSGHKAPTNAPARPPRRRYTSSPIRSPIRGSLADTELMSVDEDDDQLPAPLNVFSQPDWASAECLFARESSIAPRPPYQRRAILDPPETVADIGVFGISFAYAA